MNKPIKVRAFKLEGVVYMSEDVELSDYVISELKSGYVIADMYSYGIDWMKVISRYMPAQAKKVVEANGVDSQLSTQDGDQMDKV